MKPDKVNPMGHSGRCMGVGIAALLTISFWPERLHWAVTVLAYCALALSAGWLLLAVRRSAGQ